MFKFIFMIFFVYLMMISLSCEICLNPVRRVRCEGERPSPIGQRLSVREAGDRGVVLSYFVCPYLTHRVFYGLFFEVQNGVDFGGT